jgi:CubicO group peptidase (beta-lactamase class C family)
MTGETWFRPVSARPLAGLRVGLPLLLLLHLVWLSGDFLSLHGSGGIIPQELTDLLHDPWVPDLPTLARVPRLFGIGDHAAITILVSVYAGSLVALALGIHTRLAAFLAWSLHLSVMTSGSASYYGVDQLANTFLFYLLVFPSGRAWTLTRRPSAGREQTIPVGYLRVMQVHLCVIYLAAGLDKAMGSQWWNGEAIWQTVSQPIFSTIDLTWLARYPWIPMFAGLGTLVVEIGYAALIWPRRTRRLWAGATIGFHLGAFFFMGLVFFSSVMILLTSCLFLIPEDVSKCPVASRRGRAALIAAIGLLSSLGLAVSRQADRDETAGAATDAGESPLSPDFGSLVRRLMTRDQIPGVAVGVVGRGRIIYARGFGYRDLDKHLPVTPDTLFPLGSCSKAFTATAIALLVNEGKISLDVSVRTYLPDFVLHDPTASATLTTRDVLTHRSGLPRHDLFWYQAPFSRDELYRRLRFLETSGPAGAQWRYNSPMYVVAGRVLETVSGETWESFVRSRILVPVDMRRTVLSAEAMETDPDHAVPYALRDGRISRIPMLTRLNAIAPAGAVQSSVNDLARWVTFHATRSPALLDGDVWRELHRPQAEMPAPDQPEIQHPYYALGWIHETYRGHPLVVHNGAIDGFTVHLGFLPETGQGLILLMNRDLATEALMALAYSAYDRLLKLEPLDWEERFKERPEPLHEVRDHALDIPLETVVGRYEHPAYGSLTIHARGDQLVFEFRTLHLTLHYQGDRQFLSRDPIAPGAPQLSIRFSKQKIGEPLKLYVPLNFEDGDPTEVFTRSR